MNEESQMKEKKLQWNEIDLKDGFIITHYISDSATAGNYDVIFTAPFPCEVSKVIETHRVASSSGTLNIEKLESGEALGSGDNILATAFSTATTANTPQIKNGTDLVTSKARQLLEGDRLGLVDAGTLTSSAGVQVTVYLFPLGRGNYRNN